MPAAAGEAIRLGWTMACELRAHGVDFSFTPVLDLDYGASTVIGDRAFHRNPNAAAHLAAALHAGLRAGGMPAVGKHFPGHGHVAADSHVDVPIDERTLAAITTDDLVPFAAMAAHGLEAVMPAHVIYPAVDAVPAGYSRIWLQDILRGRLAFDGMIFSDDLGMAGAHTAGDMTARADAALAAGCDMVLVCNDPVAADELLTRWRGGAGPDLAAARSRDGRSSDGTLPGLNRARQQGCGQRPPSCRVSSSAVWATSGPSVRIRSSGKRDDGPASEIAPSVSACSS